MPEYFFHVSLELLPYSKSNPTIQVPKITGPGLQTALKAFLEREGRKSIAGNTSDSVLHSKPYRSHTPRHSLPSREPRTIAEQVVPANSDDHRLDHIYIDGTDMSARKPSSPPAEAAETSGNHINKGIGTSTAGLQTKGRYVPLEQETVEGGWGVVHLYRDAEETPGLYGESGLKGADIWFDGMHKKPAGKPHPPPRDEECTTLCILAVPSYLAPSDFLAFVGEETRNEVSHFRMIRTARANRYMVLMKFRHGKKAREWQHEWNGKVFNSMEPETCHVVFLKSVEIIPSSTSTDLAPSDTTHPKTPNDPFPNSYSHPSTSSTTTATATTAKPLPPPTPSLIELPTCPVCLERMDETTGLLTILCQHVFHCTCLQKWSGGGCPVCRYTHDDFSSRLSHGSKQKHKKKVLNSNNAEFEVDDYDGYGYDAGELECETCHADANLWQCLICGKVGCGRYEGKHAYVHYEESGHTFAMDLESKRVWDYAGDGYVHRIIQDTQGPNPEKLVELPGRGGVTALNGHDSEDGDAWGMKMENVALEYTHLLTSQLESQRVYFEEVVERAVDKASEAGRRAGLASSQLQSLMNEVAGLKASYSDLTSSVIPQLEKDRDRASKRADKFEALSRELESRYSTEKALVGNLMERIKHLETKDAEGRAEHEKMKGRMAELEEENRDLMMNFTMGEKIAEMQGEEGLEDVVEGTVGVVEQPKKKKGKGRR